MKNNLKDCTLSSNFGFNVARQGYMDQNLVCSFFSFVDLDCPHVAVKQYSSIQHIEGSQHKWSLQMFAKCSVKILQRLKPQYMFSVLMSTSLHDSFLSPFSFFKMNVDPYCQLQDSSIRPAFRKSLHKCLFLQQYSNSYWYLSITDQTMYQIFQHRYTTVCRAAPTQPNCACKLGV